MTPITDFIRTHFPDLLITLSSKDYLLPIADYHVQVGGLAPKFLGRCFYKQKLIQLHSNLVPFKFRDTFIHELCHALDFQINMKAGHSGSWKKLCRELGCLPQRVGNNSALEDRKQWSLCEAAMMLKVEEKKLRRVLRKHESRLVYQRIGKAWYINIADLEFIRSQL